MSKDEFSKDIQGIVSGGLNRVKIEFKSLEVANKIINNDVIKKNNLFAYIPQYYNHEKK